MKRIIKIGDRGEDVKKIQEALKITVDGEFGPKTLKAVKQFQSNNLIEPDGIVGPSTQTILFGRHQDEGLDTEITELPYDTLYLNRNEYFQSRNNDVEYLFYHHTAGWHNPYNVIKQWDSDTRGKIGTEWVIGGPSIKGDNFKYDGRVVKCLPEGAWAYHLGSVNKNMHTNSIGIEVCNFGQLVEAGQGFKTYAGQIVDESQIYDLGKEWRGYRYWHKYSDAQIDALYELTKRLVEEHRIDLGNGLTKWLNLFGDPIYAFNYSEDAKNGKVKGILNHSNVRKDKLDMSPQKNLIQMIKSL